MMYLGAEQAGVLGQRDDRILDQAVFGYLGAGGF